MIVDGCLVQGINSLADAARYSGTAWALPEPSTLSKVESVSPEPVVILQDQRLIHSPVPRIIPVNSPTAHGRRARAAACWSGSRGLRLAVPVQRAGPVREQWPSRGGCSLVSEESSAGPERVVTRGHQAPVSL